MVETLFNNNWNILGIVSTSHPSKYCPNMQQMLKRHWTKIGKPLYKYWKLIGHLSDNHWSDIESYYIVLKNIGASIEASFVRLRKHLGTVPTSHPNKHCPVIQHIWNSHLTSIEKSSYQFWKVISWKNWTHIRQLSKHSGASVESPLDITKQTR